MTSEVKQIIDRYPNKKEFLLEAVKILDKLILFHGEQNSIYTEEDINSNWDNLIQVCNKSIDYLIESTSISGYCKFNLDL